MCRDPHYCTLQSPTFSLPPPNLFECHPPSRMNSILYSSVFFLVLNRGAQPNIPPFYSQLVVTCLLLSFNIIHSFSFVSFSVIKAVLLELHVTTNLLPFLLFFFLYVCTSLNELFYIFLLHCFKYFSPFINYIYYYVTYKYALL